MDRIRNSVVQWQLVLQKDCSKVIAFVALNCLRTKSDGWHPFSPALAWTAKAAIGIVPLSLMFCVSTGSSLSPKLERTGFQFSSHQLDDLTGLQSELLSNSVKRCSILPRHHDDSINVFDGKFFDTFIHGFFEPDWKIWFNGVSTFRLAFYFVFDRDNVRYST